MLLQRARDLLGGRADIENSEELFGISFAAASPIARFSALAIWRRAS